MIFKDIVKAYQCWKGGELHFTTVREATFEFKDLKTAKHLLT